MIKSVTICTSASFYKTSWTIKSQLEKLGFKVQVPHTAKVMNRTKNYKVSDYKIWHKDAKFFSRKAHLMKKHFQEISKADAILVVNLEKKGQKGYLGGNVLMEMGLAFYLGKKIFLWNPVSKDNRLYEEIMGTKPIILNGNLSLLKNF